MSNRWTPVRRGKQYCSPACGRGCTVEEYRLAQQRANGLAKRLGRGWKPNVWENMGWHWAVGRADVLNVHPNLFNGRVQSYTAYLGGGRWFARSENSPEEAIKKVLAIARADRDDITTILEVVAS